MKTNHKTVSYFNRDVECLKIYWTKKFRYINAEYPLFSNYAISIVRLDQQVAASGAFTVAQQKELEKVQAEEEQLRIQLKNEAEEQSSTSKLELNADDNGVDDTEVELDVVEEDDEEGDEEDDEEDGDTVKRTNSKSEINVDEVERIKREILERNRRENAIIKDDGGDDAEVPQLLDECNNNQKDEEEEDDEEEEYQLPVRKDVIKNKVKRKLNKNARPPIKRKNKNKQKRDRW